MRCTICGRDNPAEATFCQKCGAVLIPPPAPPAPPAPPTPHLPPVTTLPLGPPPAAAPNFAGFWIRFLAALIDWMVVSAGVSFVSFLTTALVSPSAGYAFLITYPLLFAYWWLLTGLRGQTLGKMALGIQVVNREGNVPGLGRAFLREVVGKLLSAAVVYLGFLAIAWDRDKRGWHDRIAGTCVVRKNPR
jgi:uncharacterized RDD family membrane protein YckC